MKLSPFQRWMAVTVLCAVLGFVAQRDDLARAEDYQPGSPFTYLFDTGSPSARPLSAGSVEQKAGWTLVPEDTVEHEFRGDAVLLNDKLAVVLRRQGPGAEVYSQTADGVKARGVAMAAPKRAISITGISSLAIAENTPAAVALDVTAVADTGDSTVTGYRLTTGQAMLEMVPGKAADRLFVWSNPRYVVVPDFFGGDMVFDAATCDLDRYGLPAENFLLNLLDGRDAMLMCVWRSRDLQAHAILTGEGSNRQIRGFELQGGNGNTLWIALFEGTSLWGEIPVTSTADASPIAEWDAPFPAKWRCDFLASIPFAASADYESTDAATKARWSAARPDSPAVVYPLDRNHATPLTTFCPIDVLRNTLGVGPCQYILQTEGLASDANPTPDAVATWVEKQFEKGREEEAADEVRGQLAQMVDHVRHAQSRIEQYAAFAAEVRQLCSGARESSEDSKTLAALLRTLDSMDLAVAAVRDEPTPPNLAAGVVPSIVDLIGKGDALERCRGLTEQLREAGARQDRTLSRCRMAVRWLEQQARMAARKDPAHAGLARQIAARADQFLRQQ